MISERRRQKHEDLMMRYDDKKKVVYKQLVDSGYYLPSINNPMVSRDYLAAIKEFTVLSRQRADITPYYWFSYSKEIAFCVLQEICEPLELDMAFTIMTMPTKEWMVNMAYSLEPTHKAFLPVDTTILLLNDRNYQLLLQQEFQKLPSAEQMNDIYRDRLVKAYKLALKLRLTKLASEHKFIKVNLNLVR